MKFIHISDIHFGLKNNIENSLIINNFKAIQDYALKNKINHMLISGDIVEKEMVDISVRELLGNSSINYYIIPGNHDCPLEPIFSPLKNVRLFSDSPFSGENINEQLRIYGVPYTDKYSASEIFNSIADDININNVKKVIIIVHGSPIGKHFGIIDLDREKVKHFPIFYEDIANLLSTDISIYLGIGHYHSNFQTGVFNNLLWCIPGSIYPLSIKEAESRMISIYDTDTHSLSSLAINDITNLTKSEYLINSFSIAGLKKEILEKTGKLNAFTKHYISINGYTDDIKQLDTLIKEIDNKWEINHKLPIIWIKDIKATKSIAPELQIIINHIISKGEQNNLPTNIINESIQLAIKGYLLSK